MVRYMFCHLSFPCVHNYQCTRDDGEQPKAYEKEYFDALREPENVTKY